ncbi:MAG: hypothetical protein NC432_11920 [Roseburia sp.]|nr:hypothetical protein [Roseburia sp.]MCM1099531.1 hypothetical protein [Ruminococcus flavefaciens]
MKKKGIDLITEFLAEQMNHWILFPVFLLIQNFTRSERPDLLMWVLAGLFPFLFFLIRSRIKNFFLFLGAHLAVAALSLLVPAAGSVSRLLCILCAVGYLIRSCAVSLKHQELYNTEPLSPVLAAAVYVLAFLLHTYQGEIAGWEIYYLAALIGFFALYNIVQYLQHFMDFLFVNKSSAGNLPEQEMLRSGLGLVLGYTVLGSAVMFLGTNAVWLDRLAGLIKRGLFALLRAFFSLFQAEEGASEYIPDQAAPPSTGEMPFLPEAKEVFWLWRVLEAVAVIAVVCLLVYAAIRSLIRLIQWIRRHFRSGLFEARRIAEGESVDVREKWVPSGQRRVPGNRSLPALSPAARIRRLYRKTMLSHTPAEADNRKRLVFLTAREGEERTGLQGMAEVYELARYSGRKPTGEDVRRMKDACSPKT